MIALCDDSHAPTYSVEAYAVQANGRLEMQVYLVTQDRDKAIAFYDRCCKVDGVTVKWIEA